MADEVHIAPDPQLQIVFYNDALGCVPSLLIVGDIRICTTCRCDRDQGIGPLLERALLHTLHPSESLLSCFICPVGSIPLGHVPHPTVGVDDGEVQGLCSVSAMCRCLR